MAMSNYNHSISPRLEVDGRLKAFYGAIREDNSEELKSQIDKLGFQFFINDKFDDPLLYATRVGSLSIVKLLLADFYQDAEHQSIRNQSFLLSASVSENMVRQFLIADIDINYSEEGMNALYVALEKSNVRAAKLLIKYKIDYRVTTDTGETILFAAVLSGSDGMVEYFINNGIDVFHKNLEGNTALEFAISKWGADSNMVKILSKETHTQGQAP